jgi:hypothetical protein
VISQGASSLGDGERGVISGSPSPLSALHSREGGRTLVSLLLPKADEKAHLSPNEAAYHKEGCTPIRVPARGILLRLRKDLLVVRLLGLARPKR